MTGQGVSAGEAGSGSAAVVPAGAAVGAGGGGAAAAGGGPGESGLSSLHVRIAADLAGVSERTVWRWLAEDARVG